MTAHRKSLPPPSKNRLKRHNAGLPHLITRQNDILGATNLSGYPRRWGSVFVLVEPVGADFVGEMGDFEVGEGGFEAVAVGTGGEHADLDGMVGGEPCIAHHGVVCAVEGVVDFDCIFSADGFDDDVVDGAVESYDAPV